MTERYPLKQADLLMCRQKKRLVCREIFISKCIELLVDRAINRYTEINESTLSQTDVQKGTA